MVSVVCFSALFLKTRESKLQPGNSDTDSTQRSWILVLNVMALGIPVYGGHGRRITITGVAGCGPDILGRAILYPTPEAFFGQPVIGFITQRLIVDGIPARSTRFLTPIANKFRRRARSRQRGSPFRDYKGRSPGQVAIHVRRCTVAGCHGVT